MFWSSHDVTARDANQQLLRLKKKLPELHNNTLCNDEAVTLPLSLWCGGSLLPPVVLLFPSRCEPQMYWYVVSLHLLALQASHTLCSGWPVCA